MAKYYAVRRGRQTGVFNIWSECQEQIKGFSGAVYKSFSTREEAELYVKFLDALSNPANIESPIEKSGDFMDYLKVDECVAYVDGSNTNNRVGSGVVMLFGSATEREDAVSLRNVAGEINSAMIAMHTAVLLGKRKVTIIYDYAGIEEWAVGSWSTKNPMTEGYKRFYDNMSKQIEIEFVKVKGHTGNDGNEMVDKVAKRMAGVL